MLNMPAFCQYDTTWKDKVMTPGSWTLGRMGCLVTALASGIHNYAIELNPGQLCDKLVTAGAFMPSSDLTWSGFERAFPRFKVVERDDTTANTFHDANPVVVTEAVARVRRCVRRGQVVVMNVDNVGNDGVADHWVLLVNDQMDIMNPDGGRVEPFSLKYGDSLKGLKGFAVVAGTPGWFLDGVEKNEQDIGVVIGKLCSSPNRSSDLMVKESIESLTR
jgi:hypothetical protein